MISKSEVKRARKGQGPDNRVLEEPRGAGSNASEVAPRADDNDNRGGRPVERRLSLLELIDDALDSLLEAKATLTTSEEAPPWPDDA